MYAAWGEFVSTKVRNKKLSVIWKTNHWEKGERDVEKIEQVVEIKKKPPKEEDVLRVVYIGQMCPKCNRRIHRKLAKAYFQEERRDWIGFYEKRSGKYVYLCANQECSITTLQPIPTGNMKPKIVAVVGVNRIEGMKFRKDVNRFKKRRKKKEPEKKETAINKKSKKNIIPIK